ncbi:cytosine permease [Pseudomonas alvandae]|uniref:cytosine permease n=1 Tax=Pseudomonas TaxID=286 RepID=UPI00389B324F
MPSHLTVPPSTGVRRTNKYLFNRSIGEDPNGAYFYSNGVNLRAVAAFIPAALIAIILALVPGFDSVSPFSWLIGASIAGLLYLIIAKREAYYEDVSGESIAVDNVSH